VVRPSGFEPPTFCSGGINSQEINELALLTMVALHSQALPVSKHLRDRAIGRLATVSKPSMPGVGTKLGTAVPCPPALSEGVGVASPQAHHRDCIPSVERIPLVFSPMRA
jgi:hypothetical protein